MTAPAKCARRCSGGCQVCPLARSRDRDDSTHRPIPQALPPVIFPPNPLPGKDLRRILCCCALLLFLLPVRAQDTLQRILALDLGPVYLQRQDLIFSPLVHRGIAPLAGGIRLQTGGRTYREVELGFAAVQAGAEAPFSFTEEEKPKIADRHRFFYLRAAGTWARRVSGGDRQPGYLGATLAADVDLMNYVYGRTGNFGYFSTTSLGLTGKKDYGLGKMGRLSIGLQVPLVYWVARSPYLVNDDEFIDNIRSHSDVRSFFAFQADGELHSLATVQSARLTVRYQRRITQRWLVGAGYSARGVRMPAPRPLTSFAQSAYLSVGLNF